MLTTGIESNNIERASIPTDFNELPTIKDFSSDIEQKNKGAIVPIDISYI